MGSKLSSEEGLLRALEDLKEIEDSARDVYEELFGKLTDKELMDFTAWLIKAEEHHGALIEEALDLIREK